MKTLLCILLVGIAIFALLMVYAHLYVKIKIKKGELTEEQLRKMIDDKKEEQRLKKLEKQSRNSNSITISVTINNEDEFDETPYYTHHSRE